MLIVDRDTYYERLLGWARECSMRSLVLDGLGAASYCESCEVYRFETASGLKFSSLDYESLEEFIDDVVHTLEDQIAFNKEVEE